MRYLLALGVIVVIASFFTWPRVSPDAGKPILSGAQIPPRVLARIDAACRDCHSHATRYPWYSYIAPISLLVRDDVEKGRERLNLSQWAEYPSVRRQRWLSEIANQVQDGGMPLPIYTYLHRDAILSEADKELIFEWTQTERARLIAESLTP
jgi:hypothetical protein